MKVVECLNNITHDELTLFKRYKVLSQRISKRYRFYTGETYNAIDVEIINDNGIKKFYQLESEITTYFVDVTNYIREEKINQIILNKL
jgi:hypothetical protein